MATLRRELARVKKERDFLRDAAGLFELRPRSRSGIGRIFYRFLVGRRIVVLHAFIKKFQQTPDRELLLARKRMKELKAQARKGFSNAYAALELEYQVASQMLKARSRAGLTQDIVAQRMGTTKSAISRLEGACNHAPSSPR